MSYNYPIRRRRRRRRGVWVLVGIVVIAAIVALAVYLRSERRDVSAYFEVARQVMDDERTIAAELENVLRSMEDTERQDLLANITDLYDEAVTLHDALAAEAVPTPAAKSHGFLATAAASWRDGLSALDDAIVAILADPEDVSGPALLEAAFELLHLGDRAYDGFSQTLDELDEDVRPGSFPEVAFIGDVGGTLYDTALTTDRLQRLQQLTVRHDVAVTLNLDPIPAGDRNGILIIPYSESLDAQVVVSNRGNVPAQSISVTLELITIGEVDTYVVTRLVGNLAAGTNTTLTFEDLPAIPGGLYDLVVRAEIDEDADEENNVVRLLFQRNEPA
jgi:hypothetical protein